MHSDQFTFDGGGDAEAAAFGNDFAVFLQHETAHDFFAVAAAEGRIDADTFEHRLQHLRDEHAFEILRGLVDIGVGRQFAFQVRGIRLRQRHITHVLNAVIHHISSRSA